MFVDQGVDLLGRAHGKRKNAQRASEASLTWKKTSRIVVEGPLSSFKTLIFKMQDMRVCLKSIGSLRATRQLEHLSGLSTNTGVKSRRLLTAAIKLYEQKHSQENSQTKDVSLA